MMRCSKFMLTHPTSNFSTPNHLYTRSFTAKSLIQSISNESKFYFEGFKQLYFDSRQVVNLQNEISYRLFCRASRREKLFIRRVHIDQLKVIPFVLLAFLPFSTPLIIFIAWAYPIVLPTALQKPNYQRKVRFNQNLYRNGEFFEMKIGLIERAQRISDPRAQSFCNLFLNQNQDPVEMMDSLVKYDEFFQEHFELYFLSARHMNYLTNFYFTYKLNDLLPPSIQRRFLKYHVYEIRQDDAMINSNENMSSLTIDEIKEALHQRGFQIVGIQTTDLQRIMSKWIAVADKIKSRSLLLHMGPLCWISPINRDMDGTDE